MGTPTPCRDGLHRPDAVGFCTDCGKDCAPELRADCMRVYRRAQSAEKALFKERARRPHVRELLDFAAEGWSYANDYFKKKHRYEERLAKLKEALGLCAIKASSVETR